MSSVGCTTASFNRCRRGHPLPNPFSLRVCLCVCGPTSPGRHRLRQWRDDADQRERERLTASAGRLVWSTPRQDNAAEAAAGGLHLVARSACAARDGRNEKVEFNQRRAKWWRKTSVWNRESRCSCGGSGHRSTNHILYVASIIHSFSPARHVFTGSPSSFRVFYTSLQYHAVLCIKQAVFLVFEARLYRPKWSPTNPSVPYKSQCKHYTRAGFPLVVDDTDSR